VAVDLDIGEISNRFPCPYCYQAWEKRQLQKPGETAVLVTYEYEGFVTNAQGKVSFKAIRKDRFPTRREFRTLEEITSRRIHEKHPTQTLDMGREMMRHGMAKQSLSTIADFWTPRNRRAMATLWASISRTASKRVRRALGFTLTALVFRASRRRIIYCPNGGDWASTVISGTLYISSLNTETNVRDSFSDKFQYIVELAANTPAVRGMLVQHGDNTNLYDITAGSIDYIFADPPFGKTFIMLIVLYCGRVGWIASHMRRKR
jgi:hypothetical protein